MLSNGNTPSDRCPRSMPDDYAATSNTRQFDHSGPTFFSHLVELARECIEGVAVVDNPDSGVQGQLIKEVRHENEWRKSG